MCTRSLWAAVGGIGVLAERQATTKEISRLLVWSARDVATQAGRLVVALEESTYLTVLCPLLPIPRFLRAFATSVSTALKDLSIPASIARSEANAIAEVARFARNDNRSLLGSVNDVAFHAEVQLEDARLGDLAAIERAQRELNDMPHVHRGPAFPSQAVRVLFSVDSSGSLTRRGLTPFAADGGWCDPEPPLLKRGVRPLENRRCMIQFHDSQEHG